MNVHGFDLTSDWKVSNAGWTAKAEKGGKVYFMKKYGAYKMPRKDKTTSDKLFNKLKREFDEFMENRVEINKALASLAGPGGNIILPANWFVDDIYYYEASEFVGGLIEDEDILKLPRENILFIMLTAAAALHNIHRKNIVHSDLKRTNILAAKNSAGNTVAKFIDFDKSYFANNIRPEELGGDQSYMSPELALCLMTDLSDEAISYLSTKSDIFSLGVVYYNYLTNGKFPKAIGLMGMLKEKAEEGEPVYCSEALLEGGQLEISNSIKEEYLRHLLAAMLQPEPEDRPTAQEVLEVLKLKKVLPLKSDSLIVLEGGASEAPARAESAPTPSPAPAPAPAKEETAAIPTGYCAPWDDHAIKFDESKLSINGFIASEQLLRKGMKCYKLYKRDGSNRVFTLDNLTMLGFATELGSGAAKAEATPAPTPSPAPAPSGDTASGDFELWDDDSAYAFDEDLIKSVGYKSATKATKNGTKCYALIKKTGEQRFLTIDKLVLLGYVKKK